MILRFATIPLIVTILLVSLTLVPYDTEMPKKNEFSKITTLDYFRTLAEIDYVNGSSQSVFGGPYGTEISDVAVGDLEGDGVYEYVTLSKDISWGLFWISAGGVNLRVWRQNGNTFSLVDDVSWDGNVSVGGFWGASVEIYQIEPSTQNLEIVTASTNNLRNSTPDNPKLWGFLKIWSWQSSRLSLLTEVSWGDPYGGEVRTRDTAIGDVDGDGKLEICVVGNLTGHSSGSASFLAICEYSNGNLRLEVLEKWLGDSNGGAAAFSVDIGDVDGDNRPEIVTGGARVKLYPGGSYTQAGEIRVWKYDGSVLNTLGYVAWDTPIGSEIGNYANRNILCVKIRNREIFVSSVAEAGYKWGEISVWTFNQGTLNLKTSVNFLYHIQQLGMQSDTTLPFSMVFGDIDDNGVDEIVACGGTGNQNFFAYFIAVFDYSTTLKERCHSIWYDIISSSYEGINILESIDVVRREGKDFVSVVGIYVEPKQSSFGLASCHHGRVWLFEYTGEVGVPEFSYMAMILMMLLICLILVRIKTL